MVTETEANVNAVLSQDLTDSLEKSIDRFHDASDRARALLTVPVQTTSEQGVAAGALRPAVDLRLWTRHVRYARRGDVAARNAMVEQYRPHAESLARRFYRHGEHLDDLTQVAFEALLVALKRFDPERRRPFLAYAKPTITGVIQRYYRDLGWSVRVPRWVHEQAGPLRDVRDMLAQDLGREPTQAEVADFVCIPEEDLRQVMAAEEARQPGSLDVVDPVSKLQTEQVVGRADPALARAENGTALRQALDVLPDEDRDLLQRYFIEERTQAELAEELGCSQMQVSRLVGSAVRRLRWQMVGC
jgi:RNA polymerase sigma-B factor